MRKASINRHKVDRPDNDPKTVENWYKMTMLRARLASKPLGRYYMNRATMQLGWNLSRDRLPE